MYTEGETEAFINSKYKFVSKDVVFNEKNMKLYSYKKTIITDDNHSQYELGSFNYHIKNEFLKGTNISIIQNTLTEIGKSDRLFFKSGFFDLKSKNFKSAYTEINLKKSFFILTIKV